MSIQNNPEYDRRAEIETLLAQDETKLGRFWRYTLEGLDAKQISDREENPTSGWVSNYNTLINVLRDGLIPESPALARQGASKIRQWLKTKEMTRELKALLESQVAVLTSRAEDHLAQTAEFEAAVETTRRAEERSTPGVYVYTLPHYLRHPVEATTGKTLLKVGHSSKDAFYRAGSQGRLTALPEDPILLRIYPVEASAGVEREFHAWLGDADHFPARTRRGGSEWFVTSTKFLDRIAKSKGLEVIVVNEFVVDDE